MPTTRVTCPIGVCPYSLDLTWPGDDPKPPKSAVDAAFARHREAAHPSEPAQELGGSSPTSWPPGALDPANVATTRAGSTLPVSIQTEGFIGDRPNLGEAVLQETEPKT